MTFDEMVGALKLKSSPEDQKLYNTHWRPQSDHCNLRKFLPLYDFIGSHQNLSAHSRLLLKELGVWEKYGRRGWLNNKGFLQVQSMAHHRTDSNTHAKEILTPELIETIRDIYGEDYDMIDRVGLTDQWPVFRRKCLPDEVKLLLPDEKTKVAQVEEGEDRGRNRR